MGGNESNPSAYLLPAQSIPFSFVVLGQIVVLLYTIYSAVKEKGSAQIKAISTLFPSIPLMLFCVVFLGHPLNAKERTNATYQMLYSKKVPCDYVNSNPELKLDKGKCK